MLLMGFTWMKLLGNRKSFWFVGALIKPVKAFLISYGENFVKTSD